MNEDFSKNLRFLCGYYKSIADVCRKLGVNRTQFNRYLSGKHKPSANLLRKMCDFFGLEEFEIMLPHEQFQRIMGVQHGIGNTEDPEKSNDTFETKAFRQLNEVGKQELEKYLGYYFEYQMSMVLPGQVLRTLVCLKETDGKIYYQRMERVTEETNERIVHDVYQGAAFFLSDRIFLSDFASSTNFEISQTVLYPSLRNKLLRLTGLKLGIATNVEKAPTCVRVLYEYLGKEIGIKKALKMCDRFDIKTLDVSDSIIKAITNDLKEDEWQFRARV